MALSDSLRTAIEQVRESRAPALVLDHQRLFEIPAEVFELEWLESLSLRGNHLSALPPQLARLSALRVLRLGSNQLRTLDDGILALGRLEELELSNNGLFVVPWEVARLPSLQRLDLSRNLLNSVPAELAQLTALEELNLSLNLFERVPKALASMPRLRVLDLSEVTFRREVEGPLNSAPPREILARVHATQSICSGMVTAEDDPSLLEVDVTALGPHVRALVERLQTRPKRKFPLVEALGVITAQTPPELRAVLGAMAFHESKSLTLGRVSLLEVPRELHGHVAIAQIHVFNDFSDPEESDRTDGLLGQELPAPARPSSWSALLEETGEVLDTFEDGLEPLLDEGEE